MLVFRNCMGSAKGNFKKQKINGFCYHVSNFCVEICLSVCVIDVLCITYVIIVKLGGVLNPQVP